jgi:SAM-dependent methyltransferase
MPPEVKSPQSREVAAQKSFFEDDPPRLATRLFGNPDYPRNMRKKLVFAAERLAGCEHVLEIGAGRGLQLSYFLDRMAADCRYAGIDLAHGALRIATQRLAPELAGRVSLVNSTAENLPFRDATFDGMFCLDALHHVTSQEAVLREIARVLRPDSAIVCIEPNPRYPVNLVYLRDPIEQKLFDLTPAKARQWGREAGLVDVAIDHLPVFFPSFPAALEGMYEALERIAAKMGPVRTLSTTRVLLARTASSGSV